ncbi:MAG: ABC transporter ATP-binding protein [Arcanobacterium sp.]|nr:ABC transporter ATP-binding protein [Arcanobacterium sp.]
MITVENLVKRYGRKTAVDNLSFSLQPGVVTGFLGPNGSGKSTTMRCMLGLDTPDQGTILFDGVPYSKLKSPLSTVGALLDGKAFHPARTARQQLMTVATTHGISRKRVDEVLELTGLSSVAKKRLKGFSLGMGQRLGIATALLGNPEVLILDEPVNGLDPDGVRWVRDLARSYAQTGRTVLISSHLMSEMELTADNLVIIGRGKLLAEGPITKFTESANHSVITVSGPDLEGIMRTLSAANFNFNREDANEKHPYGFITLSDAKRADIGKLLYQQQIEIHELSESFSSLEDIFMELTDSEIDYRQKKEVNA